MSAAFARALSATGAGAACIALFLSTSTITLHGAERPARPEAIDIRAEPILFDREKPNRTRFGALEWRGTLRLTSRSQRFGGYSGLALDKTGTRLLALSDEGTWLSATIVYRNGRLEKLTGAKTGRLRGLGGKALARKFDRDSEAIAMQTPGALTGTAYIAFERRHRIAVYPVTRHGIGSPTRNLKLPAQARSVTENKGLEGLTVLRGGPSKGAVMAFTEAYLDGRDNHIGWLIDGPAPGQVTLKRRGGFSVTDLASLDNGDVIVLERRFRFSEGVKFRLRRIRAETIVAGVLLDGDVLIEADELLEIDNMEGLAVHRDAQGRTILTLISDNNFNQRFQRTLLMQFALIE